MLQLSRSSRCPLTRHAWKRGLEELPVNRVEEEQHGRIPVIDSWQHRLPFVSGRFRRYRKMVSWPGGLPQRTSTGWQGQDTVKNVLLFSRRKLDGHKRRGTKAKPPRPQLRRQQTQNLKHAHASSFPSPSEAAGVCECSSGLVSSFRPIGMRG